MSVDDEENDFPRSHLSPSECLVVARALSEASASVVADDGEVEETETEMEKDSNGESSSLSVPDVETRKWCAERERSERCLNALFKKHLLECSKVV